MLKRPKTGEQICKECFFHVFETEIHNTIVSNGLFRRGERVAVAASGGKDSTVLAYVMKKLNDEHDYGLELFLLSVDEGITGYRDDSLETVKRNASEEQYNIPLKIVSYKELYGWTMDEIVAAVGRKNNCTFCGIFRRQALDRGALLLKVDSIVTGHNADDIAETVLMNCSDFPFFYCSTVLKYIFQLVLRGDVARLGRCTLIATKGEDCIVRSKPFKYTYEKEIVMYRFTTQLLGKKELTSVFFLRYAYFKKLDYFSTECIYAPNAYRGHARTYLKDLEKLRPTAIIGSFGIRKVHLF